jgi:ribosomal-protein-alanine N-acetyltransferase
MEIEALSSANADELVALFERVDRSHFGHATPEAVMRFLAAPEDVFLLGRENGRVVAFGMLRGWAEGYSVPSLGIATFPEGRGYGRAMMTGLEIAARNRGAGRIRLRVHPDNLRARALYRRLGYREIGVERGETVMLLELTPDDSPQ